MRSLAGLARLTFTAFLAGLFLFLFGYPAFFRYLEKAVFIKVSTISPSEDGILPPAITFCPLTPSPTFNSGWKNSSNEFRHVLRVHCGQHNDSRSIRECVEKNTYSLNETLLGATIGIFNTKNLKNPTLWTRYLANPASGNCFMLQYPEHFTTNFEKHSIWLYFDENLIYDVYFHDPNFFFTTGNSDALPLTNLVKLRNIAIKREFDFYPLIATERRNLNRPQAPCEEKDDYNFISCINEKLVAQVGCRYPWDTNNNSNFPVCETIEQLTDLEDKFYWLGTYERKDLVAKSGCLTPCRYTKYEISSDLLKGFMEGFGVGMSLSSTEITLEEEEYIYPLLSFIAEFGGALGLFLGFSFLTLWDLGVFTLTLIRAVK